jgi:lysophosphatidate acyltransferase
MAALSSFLRLLAGTVCMALSTVIFAFGCLLLLPSRRLRIRLCNGFGHITGRACLWIMGARIHGEPEAIAAMRAHHPAIYVSNHASALDVFVGIWLSPYDTCGVAKKEVVWYPFFGQLYWISGHLMLDRGNRDRAVEALSDMAELIRSYGLGLWIWPEGTRSRSGRLLPFKKGFAHMALATRLPVVPVVVTGAHRAWEKGSVTLRPTDITLRVLEPIPTTDWTLEAIDAHIAEVRTRFVEALPEDQRPLDEEPAAAK